MSIITTTAVAVTSCVANQPKIWAKISSMAKTSASIPQSKYNSIRASFFSHRKACLSTPSRSHIS